MGKNFTAVFAVCVSLAALPLACGGDDDDGGGDGKGGKGGSGGSGTGGSATGGKGGTNTGGSATGGKGGTNTGGTTTGGTAGTAGMGGAEGGVGGAPEGGMGGEGGSGDPMSLCERWCTAGEAANCNNSHAECVTTCTNNLNYGPAGCDVLNTAMFECHVAGSSENWTCVGDQPGYDGDECNAAETAAAIAGCVP